MFPKKGHIKGIDCMQLNKQINKKQLEKKEKKEKKYFGAHIQMVAKEKFALI